MAAGRSKHRASVELYQPTETGSQQVVQLSSDWAHYGQATDGAVASLLLEWPLPGSRYGAKQYLLYLHLPEGSGVFEVGDPIATPSEDVVSGFLIQRTGRLKGVTHFVMGTINIRGKSLRRGSVELKCADRTEIRGKFIAKPGSRTTFFQHDHQLDIANAMTTARGQTASQHATTD